MNDMSERMYSNTASIGVQARPVERAKEIPSKSENIKRLLAELNEEAVGLSGTFAVVLQPRVPLASTASIESMPNQTDMGNFLDLVVTGIEHALFEIRCLRERCEL